MSMSSWKTSEPTSDSLRFIACPVLPQVGTEKDQIMRRMGLLFRRDERLLPCPFTGEEAVVAYGPEGPVYVLSMGCQVALPVNYTDDYVSIWNKRATK
jgi:hypothetical protein